VVEQPVTDGQAKLQWRADWAMRWAALGVDYEMFGKDLIPSAELGERLCRALGEPAPELFNYELFNDEHGQKISKSKGNGLSMEEWLTYASPESLSFFMYQKPKTAKRLYFDVIPKAMDEYHQHLRAFPGQEVDARLTNPAWHIHGGHPPASDMVVPYSMLLNLASAAGASDKSVLWGFIRKYAPEASPATHPGLDAAADYAVRYYEDLVKPTKSFRAPDPREAAALADLRDRLADWEGPADAEALQAMLYEIGRAHGFDPLRAWFAALYEVLLGAEQGPRFGGFIALYGVAETERLIDAALAGRHATV
jgi:lysyl-tRNA synthetase class 1